MAWVAGDQLQGGKYTIERKLKTGRFGINYIAKDKQHDFLLLKTLDVNSLTSLNQLEKERLETMFMREAVKLTLCQHEHIVKFYEPFKEAGYSCLVMEYIPGETLDKLGKISPEEALIYIQQIGAALTIVHQHHLIHGDVQPENIILRAGKSEAVLIDFDLVLDFDHELTTRRVRENVEGFASLELCTKNTKPTAASDIYSLAATFYYAITGQLPETALKRKIDNKRLTPPQELISSISNELNLAILKGMELEAKNRPKSIELWLKLLNSNSYNANAESQNANAEDQNVNAKGQSTNAASHTNNGTENKLSVNWDKRMQILTLVIAAIAAFGALLQGIASWKSSTTPPPNPTSTKK
ncbi:serine/threonine-protein kinase [Anabaena sp. AL93]|uniref:serine/threonine protein kinase n=1 Tax=Anabaena sp. AL93 TaxID=1678133 RepID=UPI0007FEA54B|nr:serine/threonine-protein kinase [Anabaena sp. AL93]OBQ21113.1 MAG: serine/threonine protein kinase [Anabaena sp. AL93]